jgi:acyl-homoserine-lactone acylase
LHVGDEFSAGGFAITGTPLPGLGVSGYAAWTFTAGGADSSDAYALRINQENPWQYEFDGQWEDMDVRKEVIRIRRDDGNFDQQTIEVLATRHGPVLETEAGVPYAAALGGYHRADILEQFFRMAVARTTGEFKAAIALDRIAYLNLVWATRDGNIGYVQTGQVPIRPPGVFWKWMIPGWTSKTLPAGRIPFQQLPTVENPACGFLQNCNTAANVVAPGVPFTRSDFPPGVLDGHYNQYRGRGKRVTELLTRVQQATLEDGRRIAFDSYVPPADLWVPIILQAFNEWQQALSGHALSDSDRRLSQAVALIGTWNRYATRESTGATVFRFWRLACDEMDSPVNRDDFQVPNTRAVRRDALAALRGAADRMHKVYGRLDVPWGEVKRMRRGQHEWPLSGDGLGKSGLDCLRATTGEKLNEEGKLISKGGQCATAVVMLTNPPVIRSVITYGQSNKPDSKHFADQAPLYSEERFREVPWTLAELLPNVESKTTYRYNR